MPETDTGSWHRAGRGDRESAAAGERSSRRRTAALAGVAIAASAQGIPAGASEPYRNYLGRFDRGGTRVVFYSDRDAGDWEIYTLDLESGAERRVTDRPGFDGEPDWAPGQRHLVAVSDRDGSRELYLLTLEGEEVAQLTHDALEKSSPVISPTEERVAFLVNGGSDVEVRVLDLRSRAETSLLRTAGSGGREAWTRDGSALVFYSYAGDDPIATLHRVGLDGSHATLPTSFRFEGNPSVSREGLLLFDADAAPGSEGSTWEIWARDLEGGPARRLTNDDRDDWGAVWAPDGRAFLHLGGGRSGRGYDVWIRALDGSWSRRLTRQPRSP